MDAKIMLGNPIQRFKPAFEFLLKCSAHAIYFLFLEFDPAKRSIAIIM